MPEGDAGAGGPGGAAGQARRAGPGEAGLRPGSGFSSGSSGRPQPESFGFLAAAAAAAQSVAPA